MDYLVGMWINIVQVGPSINGAGILSVARGIYKVPWHILLYPQRKSTHRDSVNVSKCEID